MDPKKLQKKIDKALAVLSDHDDKKDEERYAVLRSHIEEAQDYIDKGNHSHDITSELYVNLKNGIKKFEEDRFIFMIFLTILCGLLFVGVFYITYSHFYDHWHPGGHIKPPKTSRTKKTTSTSEVIITDTTTTQSVEEDNTTKTTRKTSTIKTTSKSTTNKVEEEDVTTSTTQNTTSSSTKTNKTTKETTTTNPIIQPDAGPYMVTVIFDNSSLIDLTNVYPMLDINGKNTIPTEWSLSSTIDNASIDYKVIYTINLIDNVPNDWLEDELLDIYGLRYELIIKKEGSKIYESGVQSMKDYPEYGDGIRPLVTLETSANTFKGDETLDFELRMWLASDVGNDQQGKKYRFKVFVEAGYEEI